jgi:hypothetical protein
MRSQNSRRTTAASNDFTCSLLVARLQAREVHHVIEQRMQRRDVLFQHAKEVVAQVIRHALQAEPGGYIRNHAEVAAQIVRGLPPQLGALSLQFAHLLQRLLQIPDMSRGLDLLQLKIFGGALAHAFAAHFRPDTPRQRHHTWVLVWMIGPVCFQFVYYYQLQPTPLARDFAQIVSLLPALQSVRGSVALVFVVGPACSLLAARVSFRAKSSNSAGM